MIEPEEGRVTTREFVGLSLLTGWWFVSGCKGEFPWDKEKKPRSVTVGYGASVKDALKAKASIDVRDAKEGEEIIAIGDRRAVVKGSGILNGDDGFVVLVDGTFIPSALQHQYLFKTGKNVMEVRYVPPGVDGRNVAPFMVFDVEVV